MVQPKYSALIIGAGSQGATNDIPGSENENKVISFAHAIKEHPNIYIHGFVDKDYKKGYEASQIWDAFYYASIKNAFDCGKMETYGSIDIAIVATPDETHFEVLKELAEYPLKLVIVEKPICTNLDEAREIVQVYNNKGIPLLVNYTRNFLPYFREVKKYNPVYATCHFNRGFLHSGSHAIALFEMLGIPKYEIFEMPEGERHWRMGIMFRNGVGWNEQRIGNSPVPEYYNYHMRYVIQNAYNFLEGKEELMCTADDALKVLEICYKLMEESK